MSFSLRSIKMPPIKGSSIKMPLTKAVNTEELAIAIAENRGISSDLYSGDSINGRVVRTSPIQDDNATLTIQLRGRACVAFTEPPGETDPLCLSEIDLLGDEHIETLHQGAIEIKDGSESTWEFSFDIPRRPGGRGITRMLKQEVLERNYDWFAKVTGINALPPTFLEKGRGRRRQRRKSFVEYWFVATLTTSDGRQTRAVLPVTIGTDRVLVTWEEIDDYLLPSTCDVSLNMYSLRVDTYRPYRSLSRPMDRFLRRHRGLGNLRIGSFSAEPAERVWCPTVRPVPIFNFTVEAWAPRILQPGNIHQIPFFLRIVGDTIWYKGRQVDIYDFNSCHVEELHLAVKQTTNLRGEGTDTQTSVNGSPFKKRYDVRGTSTHVFFVYRRSDYHDKEEAPLRFTGSDEWLRIPELLSFRLPVLPGVAPTFRTFNIRAMHTFSWMLLLSVEGVKMGFVGHRPLSLKGPPEPAQIIYQPALPSDRDELDPEAGEDQSDGDQSFEGDGDEKGLDNVDDGEWAAFVQEAKNHEDDEIFAP